MTTSLRALSIFGALALLLPACVPPDEPSQESTSDPDPDPLDDEDPPDEDVPLEGAWLGATYGVVLFSSGSSQPCEGSGEASVDSSDDSTGWVECYFPATDELCEFEFEILQVGGGNHPTWLDCWAEGEAQTSSWFDGERLHGRVQMVNSVYSVEISWDFDPAVL